MEVLSIIYLSYMFAGLYLTCLFLILYVKNRKDFFNYPKPKKEYGLSIVVPCYNEEESIGETIEALLNVDYSGLKRIIIVDDCSEDGSYKVIKEYAKKNDKVKAVQTPKNTGCAAGSKNFGSKFVNTELIGYTDADSFPKKDSIGKMVGFFNDEEVGAVTGSILVKNTNKFFPKIQSIEYAVIIWTRKLLGYVDAIYVTPGPLTIYRRNVLEKIGYFDEDNLTEDIEMTWRLAYHGYKRELSPSAKAFTKVPEKFGEWKKQRVRWNIGGIQTINKYKSSFIKKGILGSFILPFFVISLLLGVVGISIFIYLMGRRIFYTFLYTNYSVNTQTSVLAFEDLHITPSILNYYGISLFLLGLIFTGFALKVIEKQRIKNINIFDLMFYMIIYLTIYPFIIINAGYKFLKKDFSWGTKEIENEK